jgi:hypothetical protein
MKMIESTNPDISQRGINTFNNPVDASGQSLLQAPQGEYR